MPDDQSVPGRLASAEFQAPDRTGQHRIVASSMLVTAIIVGLHQSWWKQIRDFVTAKTHPPQDNAATQIQGGINEVPGALKWLMGLFGTWVILTLMVDLEDTAELAVALSLVIAGSVTLEYGPSVFPELGISTKPGGK